MSVLTVMPSPVQTFLYPSGAPVAGGQVYFYVAGSSTLQDTYSDVGGAIANTNPVILDSAGKATIYWLPASYRVVLYDSVANGSAQIWDRDNIAATPRFTGAAGWIDVGFSATDYTASSGLWTVTSGNVSLNRYKIVDNVFFWEIQLQDTTVSATPSELSITVPSGVTFTAPYGVFRVGIAQENGVFRDCYMLPTDSTHLSFVPTNQFPFTATTMNTLIFASGWWQID